MRAGVIVAAIVALLAGAVWWLKFESHAPQAVLATPVGAIGRKTPLDIDVRGAQPGLRDVTVRLQAGGQMYELGREAILPTSWRGSGVTEKRVHIEPDLQELRVPEGPATLEVLVDTYAWHVLSPGAAPQLELLTTQHNGRLGGVELAVFRQGADTASSGIEVGPYFFPATAGLFQDAHVAVAFFAIPQDLTADVRPRLVAQDAAGNRREVSLPAAIKPRRFAERTLAVDDDFLARKVPELERENNLQPAADLVKGYLEINGDLRRQSEAKIKEVTAKSSAQPLWDGAFQRQTNAAPLSAFADRRTYTYKGETIDHQTHLGYDLASLKNSPVDATQNGIVVFAGNLGIYGNTVILDHGLGIFSLYGHLSTIAVQVGESVKKGQSLGQTGDTGLAAGDHLHFSIMLYGVHVDPVEWWDPQWIREHVNAKLTMLPRAAVAAEPAHAQP
jgi:murein DD-endopeptidase MepM/ murein hydrolase activator NlpD